MQLWFLNFAVDHPVAFTLKQDSKAPAEGILTPVLHRGPGSCALDTPGASWGLPWATAKQAFREEDRGLLSHVCWAWPSILSNHLLLHHCCRNQLCSGKPWDAHSSGTPHSSGFLSQVSSAAWGTCGNPLSTSTGTKLKMWGWLILQRDSLATEAGAVGKGSYFPIPQLDRFLRLVLSDSPEGPRRSDLQLHTGMSRSTAYPCMSCPFLLFLSAHSPSLSLRSSPKVNYFYVSPCCRLSGKTQAKEGSRRIAWGIGARRPRRQGWSEGTQHGCGWIFSLPLHSEWHYFDPCVYYTSWFYFP